MSSSKFPDVDASIWRAQVERELKGASWDEALRSMLPGGIEVEALYSECGDALPAIPPDAPTQLCMPYVAELVDEDTANDVRFFWSEDTPSLPNDATLLGEAADAWSAQEAGAGIPLELAIALAGGVEMLRNGTAPKDILFRVGVGNEVFAELAKLRTLRTLWAGIQTSASLGTSTARIHAVSSRLVLSDADRWVNILRVGGSAFAAILGGADFFTPRPFEARSAGAHRLARNTVHMLLAESHLDWYRDPAAGSFYLESLSAQLAEHAWKLFQEIESRGGLAEASADGWLDQQIEAAYHERLARLEEGTDVLVGVTKFPNAAEEFPEPTEGELRLARVFEDRLREEGRS